MQIAFLASNYTVMSTASRGVFYCHSCRKEEALEVLLGENRQASYMSFLVLFICSTGPFKTLHMCQIYMQLA